MTVGGDRLFCVSRTVRRDPEIEAWLAGRPDALGAVARHWFEVMRGCGDDVLEVLHDDMPTACIDDAAFAYVAAYTRHVNVGFFRGVDLPDPAGLLEGTGKAMRHAKSQPDGNVDAAALTDLIVAAYADMRDRLRDE